MLADSNVRLSTYNYSHPPVLITPSSWIPPISRKIYHTHIPHLIKIAAPTVHITCSVDAKFIAPAFFFPSVGAGVGAAVTVIVYLGIVVVMIGTDKEELVGVDEVVESEFVFDEEEPVVIIEEDPVLVWDCD
jgi:hypothetical protein